MPDLALVLGSLAAAAAAGVLLACAWPWRAAGPGRVAAGWVLGVGLGFFLGCRLLGLWPHWPPREDQDRLLALLVPAVIAVELVAAFPPVPRWLTWLLRLVVAGGAARVLLDDTSYLTDLAGPGTREWTPEQARLILAGLALALATLWVLLALLARRPSSRSLPPALALACAAAAVAVML